MKEEVSTSNLMVKTKNRRKCCWTMNATDAVIFNLFKLHFSNLPLDLKWIQEEQQYNLDGCKELGKLDLSGSRSLTNLEIEMGVGEALVDLTGIRENDLNATIEGGIGDLILRLLSDVGVCVDVKKGIGDINANNLKKDGNTYFNDIYGKTNVTLSFDIETGVGEIKLE